MSEPLGQQRRLPERLVTHSGDVVYPNSGRWTFRSEGNRFSFNFSRVPAQASPLLDGWKRTLLWYIQHHSGHHASSVFNRVLHLVRYLAKDRCDPINEISPADLLNYRASLPPHQEWYLSTLAGVFRRWHAFGHAGIGGATAELLREIALPGNAKGEAVRTACPISGPLTEIEFAGVISALDRLLLGGDLGEEDYLIVWLSGCLGLRPIQIAQMKLMDLHEPPGSPEGQWLIEVPRAKQPGLPARSEMKTRPLAPRIGALLHRHAARIRHRFSGDMAKPPMFPARRLKSWLPGFEWHRTSGSISSTVKAVAEQLYVTSERTGGVLDITPRRLRRSLGTRAANEGYGIYEIAEMLDHTDTQNALVYIEAGPDIVDRLDKALALKMAPLAQAFMGQFASDPEKLEAPGGVVHDRRLSSPVGSCGDKALCGFAAPIACYTCRQFRPWRDGPHAAVLDRLLHERERIRSMGDHRIAAVNDRTILAVAEVVRLCEEAVT